MNTHTQDIYEHTDTHTHTERHWSTATPQSIEGRRVQLTELLRPTQDTLGPLRKDVGAAADPGRRKDEAAMELCPAQG